MALQPFTVRIDDDRHTLLDDRLRTTVWADEPSGAEDWRYGVAGRYLRELVAYWREAYDWRVQEAAMNRWPHVRGEIDGVTVHALYERGSGPMPLPLVLTHGWPWTFWDFAKVIEPLAHPERFGDDPRTRRRGCALAARFRLAPRRVRPGSGGVRPPVYG